MEPKPSQDTGTDHQRSEGQTTRIRIVMHLGERVLAASAWRPSHQHPKEPDLVALSENIGERTYGGINF